MSRSDSFADGKVGVVGTTTVHSDPYLCEAGDPVVPNRFRAPLLQVVDHAMPADWLEAIGAWLQEHRHRFVRGGDEQGAQRHNWELCELDRHCPELVADYRKRVVELYPAALEACAVPAFDLRYVEVTATMHHHGSHFCWHDDAPGYDGNLIPSRRLSHTFYMHTDPKRFEGGELEFLDGTTVEPRNNRMTFFHPIQQHRVRAVECWSSRAIDGRWALIGWIHGDPPPGWVERIPALRGIPFSG